MRAIRDIHGIEFLAELLNPPSDPDDDFFHEDQAGQRLDKSVQETLYVVMSDARAVGELVRLFEIWQADQSATFPSGYAPLKQVFVLLRAVRRWGPEDRVRESGLLEVWREDVETIGASGLARVEIELWFRQTHDKRMAAQNEVEQIVRSVGGAVVRSLVTAEIEYHAVLADIPHSQVEAVLADGAGAIQLLTSDAVMLVAPSRPMMVRGPGTAEGSVSAEALGPVPSNSPPRIALLDGLPLANHVTLSGRLVVDDPDDLAREYTIGAQQHGTAMASLICHGDLSAPGPALPTPLYVRPIFQQHEFFPDAEVVPPNELLVDLLHRAFRRMFEGDGDRGPAAPSVRIVNLSIGDPSRVFVRRLSPVAKLLDWISHKYNVLVLVSSGNHSFEPEMPTVNLDNDETLQETFLQSRREAARVRGLLSPAESINALTVGSIHADSAESVASDTIIDPTPVGLPAPYGATGFGYRRSVKPEIFLPGGRRLYQRPIGQGVESLRLLEAEHSALGPGLRVAAPTPGGGNAGTIYGCGTSNSTAQASRAASQIFDVLEDLVADDGMPVPDAQYHPVLAKTLLVHAASWGESGKQMRDMLHLDARSWRREITQLYGYGAVSPDNVASGARTRVVLLGAGSIRDQRRQTFRLPLPPSLAATTSWRRLTITLGWLSPINPRSRIHRQARLRFSPPDGQLGGQRTEADNDAARMGTVQHEIFEGTQALAFSSGDTVEINVDCRVDAGPMAALVRYGLAVSIEMADSVRADLHAEIRSALRVQARTQAQVPNR